jgi:hypothetical protein
MKVISERLSILKKDDLLSIVILPTTNKKKMALMFLWLMAWTVCGIIVFMNYFKVTDQGSKLFIIIYLSFWLYFEVNITRSYMWKRWGKEKLWIKNGVLYYQREINGKGKISEFNLDLVSKLNLIELKASRFTDTINQSFWVKGGERVEFSSQSKTLRLGMQLSDDEAKTLIREVNRLIP